MTIDVEDIEHDPIDVLIEYLAARHPPPLAWAMKWLDRDASGADRFDRAWAVASFPPAMARVLGKDLSDLEPNYVTKAALHGAKASALPYRAAMAILDAGMETAKKKTPSTPGEALKRWAMPLGLMGASMLQAALTKPEPTYGELVAARIRAQHPVPPTLQELFVRFGIGTETQGAP